MVDWPIQNNTHLRNLEGGTLKGLTGSAPPPSQPSALERDGSIFVPGDCFLFV